MDDMSKLRNRNRQRRALILHHFSKSHEINAPRLKGVLTLFISFFLCLLVLIVFNLGNHAGAAMLIRLGMWKCVQRVGTIVILPYVQASM